MSTKNKTNLILLAILILGSVLRFSFLTYNPPSLNWDEVSHGYNAYSILKTGKDEWGKNFPISNFRTYGDYPLPLNLYATIPFIKLLGLNTPAVRFPHALAGSLTILAVYFLVLGVSKNKNLALLSGFLTAVSPWYLFTSRYVVQANWSIFLLISALAAFFHRDKHRHLLSLSVFLFFLSLFAYHTTRIFSPIILAALLFLFRKEIVAGIKAKKAVYLVFTSLAAVFYIVFAILLANPESQARSKFVFLINDGMVARIIEARNVSKFSPWTTRLIHNRVTYFTTDFIKNYIGYFSPKYLFTTGGTQYQFSVPGWGLYYLVCLPFFYLGLWEIIKKAKLGGINERFLLGWLILAPIPASLTTEKFAVLRSSTMLPLPEILIGMGLFKFINVLKLKKQFAIGIFIAIVVMSLTFYLNKYFTGYRKDYSWSWQYGYKEAIAYAKQNYAKYDKIIITKKYGEPHEFLLFFWPWDPEKYRSDPNLIRFYQSNWYWVDRFDKFYFVNDWQVKEMVLESGGKISCEAKNCLLITSPGNYPSGWHKIETINFLDGKPAFEIYENQ